MDKAYTLVFDGWAETAILARKDHQGKKYRVRVRNAAPPGDVMVVESWWTKATDHEGWDFVYMNGNTGEVVSCSEDQIQRALKMFRVRG